MPRSTDMRGRTVYFIDHECLWPRAVRHPPTATRADPLALAQRHLRLGVWPLDQRPARMALGARPLGQARAGMGVHRRPLGALMRLGAPCLVGRQYGRRRAEPPFLPLHSADNIGDTSPPREADARPPAATAHDGAPRRHIDFRH